MLRGVNRHIFKKLHIKGGARVPYSGWLGYTGTGGYTRDMIPELFNDFGYKVGAEIGVMNGAFSHVILTKNPTVKMYCIDPWTPWPGSRATQNMCERRLRRAQRLLTGFDVAFIRKTSMEALADVPDGSLDFVYIDACHDFDNVMMDLIGWNKKVRQGGMISGHDYVYLHDCGVIPAVDAFTHAHDIKYWYITNEYLASFFWVKS
jgi:hypothetical protein